jgi:hypothetical protein
MTRSVPRFLALLGSCLLGACVQPSPPASDEQSAPTPATKSSPSPAAPDRAQPLPSDRAHVSVDGVGLHILDDSGWRLALESRSPIRDMLMLDGQLFVLSAFGVQRVDASGRAETIAPLARDTHAQLGDPLALATVGGRTFWIAGALGVARHTEMSWQLTPLDGLDAAPKDLVLDRTGRPWLALDTLHHYHDDRWQLFAADLSGDPLALAADPRSDAIYVHAGCQPEQRVCTLLKVSADQPPTRIELPTDSCSDYARMALSSDGTIVALAGSCGFVRQNLDGDPKPLHLGLSNGWPGQPVRTLALDESGRVWAGTNNGLLIIAADGDVQEYPLAQLGDIAGAVGSMLVEGNGPPAPNLGRAHTGGLAGTVVVLEGTIKRPLPGVRLELCNRLPPGGELQPDPARSPCAGVESVHTTTTDPEGRFELSNLTIDHYYFGVEIDGRWARAQPKALNMRAGMNGNVGKLVVELPQTTP